MRCARSLARLRRFGVLTIGNGGDPCRSLPNLIILPPATRRPAIPAREPVVQALRRCRARLRLRAVVRRRVAVHPAGTAPLPEAPLLEAPLPEAPLLEAPLPTAAIPARRQAPGHQADREEMARTAIPSTTRSSGRCCPPFNTAPPVDHRSFSQSRRSSTPVLEAPAALVVAVTAGRAVVDPDRAAARVETVMAAMVLSSGGRPRRAQRRARIGRRNRHRLG
jgi:hypothetical protein